MTIDQSSRVNLSFWDAATVGSAAVLRWEIEFEPNIVGFSVLRSFNGDIFDEIAYVNAEGMGLAYLYTDEDPYPVSYYKLGIMSRNGDVDFTQLRKTIQHPQAEIKIYPNPVVLDLHVEGARGLIKIYSLKGKLLRVQKADGLTTLPLKALRKGHYMVQVNGCSYKFIKK